MTTTGAAAGTRHYAGTFPADPAQVRQARAALAALLGDSPLAGDAILVLSELVTNSVRHSASSDGGEFTVRAEVRPGRLRIEVQDAGGPWRGGPRDDGRPHGFDVVDAIAGAGNWASTGTRAGAPPGPGSAGSGSETRMTVLPPPAEQPTKGSMRCLVLVRKFSHSPTPRPVSLPACRCDGCGTGRK